MKKASGVCQAGLILFGFVPAPGDNVENDDDMLTGTAERGHGSVISA